MYKYQYQYFSNMCTKFFLSYLELYYCWNISSLDSITACGITYSVSALAMHYNLMSGFKINAIHQILPQRFLIHRSKIEPGYLDSSKAP